MGVEGAGLLWSHLHNNSESPWFRLFWDQCSFSEGELWLYSHTCTSVVPQQNPRTVCKQVSMSKFQ